MTTKTLHIRVQPSIEKETRVHCRAGRDADEVKYDPNSRQQRGASTSGRTADIAPPDLAGTTYEAVLLALLEGLR